MLLGCGKPRKEHNHVHQVYIKSSWKSLHLILYRIFFKSSIRGASNVSGQLCGCYGWLVISKASSFHRRSSLLRMIGHHYIWTRRSTPFLFQFCNVLGGEKRSNVHFYVNLYHSQVQFASFLPLATTCFFRFCNAGGRIALMNTKLCSGIWLWGTIYEFSRPLFMYILTANLLSLYTKPPWLLKHPSCASCRLQFAMRVVAKSLSMSTILNVHGFVSSSKWTLLSQRSPLILLHVSLSDCRITMIFHQIMFHCEKLTNRLRPSLIILYIKSVSTSKTSSESLWPSG